MPFEKQFEDVWRGGITKALKSQGFKYIRIDEIKRSTNIVKDITDCVVNCSFAIFDVTGNNPNVMFELGLAVGKQKTVIIISQSRTELPFDIGQIRIIFYDNSWGGIEKLRRELERFLTQMSHEETAKRAA
jgi:predicted nucleotide-binding protein